MQRDASSIASSMLYPRQTSSKLVALTFGSCSLTGTLFKTLIFNLISAYFAYFYFSISCFISLRSVRSRRDGSHPQAPLTLLCLLLSYRSADASLPRPSLPDDHQTSPPTDTRHPPHIPVPSTMIGFKLTIVGIPSSFVSLHTNFIMIIGPIATHTSYCLP